MGHWPGALRHRQGAAHEQLAPAVGRHPHLLRSAAHRARGHLVRRRVGGLPGAAPVLHRVRRLDADHQQPGRIRPLRPGAERRRLRARRPGETVRHAHRDDQGEAGRRHDAKTNRWSCGAACTDPSWPSGAACPLRCTWRRSIGRRCSSSSGAWAWPRTTPSGTPRCACSSCRSSTPPTPTATATSATSTTPPCGSIPPATTASGRASCPATGRISSPPRSCPTTRCRRCSTRPRAGCRTRTTCRGRPPIR